MDEVMIACPYCNEAIALEIDPETLGEFVQDCEVCCRPWLVRVSRDHEGGSRVQVERAQ